jgi:hypothetical protein
VERHACMRAGRMVLPAFGVLPTDDIGAGAGRARDLRAR